MKVQRYSCSVIFISINLVLLIKCPTVQSEKRKNNKEICFDDRSTTNFRVCYVNDITNYSSLVWFTIDRSLNITFDSYRFVLRSIDDLLFSNVIIATLTNFTTLADYNNSLRIFNLDSGLYEVCIELQSNKTTFIYKPRDACISIRIGKSLNESFKHDSTPLLIALASGIVLFFILGLVVQQVKERRRKQELDNASKPRSRSSSLLSMTAWKQQRDRVVRSLFHRHIEEPRVSSMRQWARNLAFRHRISTEEHDFEKPRTLRRWSKHLFTSTDQSSQPRSRTETIQHDGMISSLEPASTTNNIYTISDKEHHQMPPRKISFNLSPPEEYEMT